MTLERLMPRVTTVLLIFALGLLGSPASAGDPDKKKDSPAAQAFDAGTELYSKKDYHGAITAFERSYQLHPHFLTVCNIARCHERLNDVVKAAETYRRCMKDGGDKSPKASSIRAALEKADGQIAWFTITSPGKGGTVWVDGKSYGLTPVKVPLNPGPHRLEVHRSSARTARLTVQAQPGESGKVELIPQPLSEEPPSPYLDDAGEEKERQESTTKGLSSTWFWIGAALTAGLAITGTVLGVQTLQANSDYEETPTEEAYNRVLDRRLLTNIIWGVTAGAAGATTVLFFFTDFGGSAEQSADNGQMALGLGIRGRF